MLPHEDRPFDQAQYDASLRRIAVAFLSDRYPFHLEHFSEGQSKSELFEYEHERIVLAPRDRHGVAVKTARFLAEKMKQALGDDLVIEHGYDLENRPFISISGKDGPLT